MRSGPRCCAVVVNVWFMQEEEEEEEKGREIDCPHVRRGNTNAQILHLMAKELP